MYALRASIDGAALGVKYTVDPNEKLVIVTFSGQIGDADPQAIGSATKSHTDFDPSFSAAAVQIFAQRTRLSLSVAPAVLTPTFK